MALRPPVVERMVPLEAWRERILPSVRLQPLVLGLREARLPAQVVRVVALQGLAALGARAGSVAVLDGTGSRLEVLASHGFSDELVHDWRRFRVDAPIPAAEAVRRGEPVLVESLVGALAAYPGLAPAYAELGNVAAAAIPLLAGERVMGVVWATYAWTRKFGESDRALIRLLADYSGEALARARRRALPLLPAARSTALPHTPPGKPARPPLH